MSNERPDEFLSWRTKLTQPDALPEQGLDDPESAWQKLYTRLGEKPRRRLFYWYGAAACLLLTLIPAALLFRPASPLRPGPGSPSSPAKDLARIDRPAPLDRRRPSPSDRRRPSPSDRWRPSDLGARPISVRPISVRSISAIASPSDGSTPPSSPGTVPPSPAQGPQLAQQPPVQRTLRVVSINELDNPPAIGPALTLARASVPFKVRIHPDKGLTGQVSADRGADPEFLKLKIPLQNP